MSDAQAQESLAFAVSRSLAEEVASPPRWSIHSGHDQLIAFQPQLEALAERCGQGGSMHSLDYSLQVPYSGSKLPHPWLRRSRFPASFFARRSRVPVLLVESGPHGLTAAVLLHQYHLYGIPTSAFVASSWDGWRMVVAPRERRAEVSKEAAELLLANRASVVLVSFNQASADELANAVLEEEDSATFAVNSPSLVGTRTRQFRHVLPLKETFDETLATMGAHTRRNLRALERRAVKELGAAYVPLAEVSLEEFLKISRECTHTVPDWVAEWRYRTARTIDGGVFTGLRAADGRWLSLLGGRRYKTRMWIDWQMNLASSGPLSLVTAMRSFVIAHEIKLGMRSITFENGTGHSMNKAFVQERATDLLFARRGLSKWMLQLIGRLLPQNGDLADTLLAENLEWRERR